MNSFGTNLVLIGYMGSGKSSLGRMAARDLGFRFLDTDALIVERVGFDIPTIFSLHGEAFFREQESKVIASLAGEERCVISTGGGAILSQANREKLREIGYVVLLTASEETIWDRVSRNSKRPLLRTENPRATVSRMLAERRPLYEAAAHFAIDSTTHSRDDTLQVLLEKAREVFGAGDRPPASVQRPASS